MIPQIRDFDDFCLWMYCIVEDTYRQVSHLFSRPGPAPICSDSELMTLMTMVVVGECKGWDVETSLLSEWAAHRDLFPTCLRRVASIGDVEL